MLFARSLRIQTSIPTSLLILTVLLLALGLSACSDDDDPNTPAGGNEELLPDLADLTQVSVEAFSACTIVTSGWYELSTEEFGIGGTIAGALDDSSGTYSASHVEHTDMATTTRWLTLSFDAATGAIDSLYSYRRYATPVGATTRTVTAVDVPLQSEVDEDGNRTVVWRVDGHAANAAILDLSYEVSGAVGSSVVMWNCVDEENPGYLEIRLTNF